MCTGQEDRGGCRPDAGCMTQVRGTGNMKREARPGGDEWPGW